jgi:hypothetical protein
MGAGIRNKSKTIRAAALFFGLLAVGGIVAAVSMSTNYKISNAVVTAGGGKWNFTLNEIDSEPVKCSRPSAWCSCLLPGV